MAKTKSRNRDSDRLRELVADAEPLLHDLRRGIGVLSAIYGPVSVEEAGISWIAEKLSESLTPLEALWGELHGIGRKRWGVAPVWRLATQAKLRPLPRVMKLLKAG